MVIFFKRIKDTREDKDFTQTAFSQLIFIPRQTYSMYENGFSNIPLDKFDRIAKALGVSIDYLTGRTDQKNYKNTKEMSFASLSQNLKQLRISNGKNQKEFADLLGITQQAWSYYECGKKHIPSSKLYNLAVHYQVSLDYLIGRIDHKPKL